MSGGAALIHLEAVIEVKQLGLWIVLHVVVAIKTGFIKEAKIKYILVWRLPPPAFAFVRLFRSEGILLHRRFTQLCGIEMGLEICELIRAEPDKEFSSDLKKPSPFVQDGTGRKLVPSHLFLKKLVEERSVSIGIGRFTARDYGN
jgi:hypothetical protein